MTIELHFSLLSDSFKLQLANQGISVTRKEMKDFELVRSCIYNLYYLDYLNEKQKDKALLRLMKELTCYIDSKRRKNHEKHK